MDIREYQLHYERFHEEFGIDTSVKAKTDKLIEEVCEYLEEPSDDEALDIMNVAISLVMARGIKNPLFAGYLKLQRNTEKYRGNNVGTTR